MVADALHPEGVRRLERWARVSYLPDRAGLRAAGATADGLVVRLPITADELAAMPRLRAIVRCGAGIDGIPQDYTASRRIAVGNTPGANADAVAEYVFAALLQAARNLPAFTAAVRTGDWQARSTGREQSFEWRGRRLGIVGMGEIGQRVARIGHFGFGMQVQASVSTSRALPEHVQPVDIDMLCATSDALVLCCSLTPATRGLIDGRRLRSLPAGGVLVNVARGAVIDEDALLAFAADPRRSVALMLDVFHASPLPPDHPLAHAHLCWPTPHVAGITRDAELRMGAACDRILAQLLAPPVPVPAA